MCPTAHRRLINALTPQGRVVLKRTRNDGVGAREDFLARGTLARGARELGQARLRPAAAASSSLPRSPPPCCAILSLFERACKE